MQASETVERRAYTRQEAANALSLSKRTIDKLLADGSIRCVRIGRRVVVPRDEIERILDEGVA